MGNFYILLNFISEEILSIECWILTAAKQAAKNCLEAKSLHKSHAGSKNINLKLTQIQQFKIIPWQFRQEMQPNLLQFSHVQSVPLHHT